MLFCSRMEPRKLPPHHVELDAIQQNSTQIRHKIHFPNDTDEVKTPTLLMKTEKAKGPASLPGGDCILVLSEINLILLQIFEVATNTRIKDLILNISRKLELSSADGFSIFVKTNDKVHSVFLYIYTIECLASSMN